MDSKGLYGLQVDGSIAEAGCEEEFEVRELLEEVCGEGGAFAHGRDDGVGFKAGDELLFDFWGR